MQHQNEKLQKLRSTLSDEERRLNELNREQRASSWLTRIPLSEESYDLTKQLFWDLIHIRYGWTLTRLHLFFYKKSSFVPCPENCLSFSKK